MREIRFRAWHKIEKRMFRVFRLTWYKGIFLVGEENEIKQRWGSGEVELMQFTGLKDKNGKEIYEGDIVSIFIDGKEYWQLSLLKKANHMDSPIYIANHFTQSEADTMEVIGNIYENPELLEK